MNELADWAFTFGHGQEHFGKYVRMNSMTYGEARKEMNFRHQNKWAMMYKVDEDFKRNVIKWNWTELK